MINHVQFPNLGIEVTINRVAFSVFGFDIYWYGVIFAFTIIRGASVALYLGKKLGINDDDFIDIIMLGTVFGIIGARAFFAAFIALFSSFFFFFSICAAFFSALFCSLEIA